MSENRLPELTQAYESLCKQGEQFAEDLGSLSCLSDVCYSRPTRGLIDVMVDERVLPVIGKMYAKGDIVDSLLERGANAAPLSAAVSFAEQLLECDAAIWGFSGFATPGHNYEIEARGLNALYDYLTQTNRLPGLSVDGALRTGVPGLNGVVAAQHQVPTLGCTSLEGLAKMAPRDHMVVWGERDADRQVLVGTLPDILVCVGGGDGTLTECLTALECGSVVLLLALKDYGSASFVSSHETLSELTAAASDGQLEVCHSLEDIAASADKALQASDGLRPGNRPARRTTFRGLLEF